MNFRKTATNWKKSRTTSLNSTTFDDLGFKPNFTEPKSALKCYSTPKSKSSMRTYSTTPTSPIFKTRIEKERCVTANTAQGMILES